MPVRYDANGRRIEENDPARAVSIAPAPVEVPGSLGAPGKPGKFGRTGRRYDVDGNAIPEAPATAAETTSDIGTQLVVGLQRGVAGMGGMARDMSDLSDAALRWGIRQGARLGGHQVTDEQVEALARGARGGRDLIETVAVPGAFIAEHGPSGSQINEGIQQVFGEQPEAKTTAGEYARTIGEFAPAALIPGSLPARVARVVVPGVASETAGQITEGTPAEPWARLGAGIFAGGVTEGFLTVLTRAGRTPDQRALRLMLRELEDQGQSTDDIVRQANVLLKQAPTEEVLAEVLGPGGLRLARAVANMGRGAGRATAEEALAVRAEGGRAPAPTPADPNRTRAVGSIRDRIMDEAARMTAPQQNRAPRNYWDALNSLRTARAGQGADAYAAAYAATPDQAALQQHLLPYMETAPAEAFKSAERQLASVENGLRAQVAAASQRGASAESIAKLQGELDDVVSSRAQVNSLAEGQRPNTLSPRAIDYVGRGLSQMERTAGLGSPEARAIGDARRSYNQMVDQILPELGQARQHYGASMRIEELMNDGRRVFNMSEGEIDRLMQGSSGRGLSIEEFDGFMLGVMDSIEQKLGSSDTGFLARLRRNENWRNQLTRAVGGEGQAKRFLNRLAREANMQQTRSHVVAGSRTAGLQEDIAALTQGEAEFAFMNDNARQLIANGGQLRPMVIRWVLGAYDRFARPGLRNPQVQEQLARRLFTRVSRDSAKELRDALNAAKTDPSLPTETREWLNRMLSANAATDDRLDDETQENGLVSDYLGARQAAEGSEAPIDTSRPMLDNPDGSFSTERTITVGADGRFFNIPTIVDGRQRSEREALALWRQGSNPEVGSFATEDEALQAARARSERIGQVRAPERVN